MEFWLGAAFLFVMFLSSPIGELVFKPLGALLDWVSTHRPRSQASVKRRREKEWARQRAERERQHWRQRAGRPTLYDDHHRAVALEWQKIISREDVACREKVCIMPTRVIAAGSPRAAWNLAHDHTKGDGTGHLGPAHTQCNQAEALRRGKTWPGAPTLYELLKSVGYQSTIKPHTPVTPPSPMTKEDPWGGIDPWANA